MNLFAFLTIIIVVAILADSYAKHQKNKMRFQGNDKIIGELKEHIKTLEKRIENLEIIAVSDPDSFEDRAPGYKTSSYDSRGDYDPAMRNERLINDLARKKSSGR
ncbi:MAG: hypothetical protein LAT67_02920 [Balneolales bacterium]|nr:hypothetical protein [Balneolales bacterium]